MAGLKSSPRQVLRSRCGGNTAGWVTFVTFSWSSVPANMKTVILNRDLVGLVKQFFGQRIGVVEVFAHAYKLRALSGEYKCFHCLCLYICFDT